MEERIPTQTEIVAATGRDGANPLSASTVYRVMAGMGQPRPATLERVRAAITELGGDPDALIGEGSQHSKGSGRTGRPRAGEGPDVSKVRARRAREKRNDRWRRKLIAEAAEKGWVEDDVLAWLQEDNPRPPWDPWRVVHLVSRPGNVKRLARLVAVIDALPAVEVEA